MIARNRTSSPGAVDRPGGITAIFDRWRDAGTCVSKFVRVGRFGTYSGPNGTVLTEFTPPRQAHFGAADSAGGAVEAGTPTYTRAFQAWLTDHWNVLTPWRAAWGH